MDIRKDQRIIRISDQLFRYAAPLEKHFEIYFNAVEPQKENGFLVVDFSSPSWHRYRHNNLEFKLSSLPEEPEALADYFKYAQGTKLAFDAGAYCGLSTYEMSQHFEKVIAFEPDNQNRACLVENVIRHKMTNVTIVPFAMTVNTGSAIFYEEGSLGSRMALPHFCRPPLLPVKTISLVDACETYGIPDFICMDIEGAEIEVLAASYELLLRERISLTIDTNHREATGFTFGEVETILRACGYQTETEKPGGFYTTWGWK
jgi:FkbM family methyltransferase